MTYLVRVSVEVKILQETSSKFTEQEVVCVINGPQTPVGVIVGAGACTEWTHYGGGGEVRKGGVRAKKQGFTIGFQICTCCGKLSTTNTSYS